MDTLEHIILSIVERLSSFRGKNVYRLVYWKVSFIQSVLYQRFHCIGIHTLILLFLHPHYRLFAGFLPRVSGIALGGFVFLGAYEKSRHHLTNFF